jgi:hypothetical protein
MSKNKPQVKFVNCQTGEEIIKDADAAQIADFAQMANEKAEAIAEVEAKAAQRQLILDKLGLTADEAQLLLG